MTLTGSEEIIAIPIAIIFVLVFARHVIAFLWNIFSVVIGAVFSVAIAIGLAFGICYVIDTFLSAAVK